MHRFSEISAVIFDMDGLVLDTESTYFAAWQLAADLMGKPLSTEFFKSLSGMHYTHIQQKLLLACGNDFDLKAFHQIGGHIWRTNVSVEGIQIKPGVTELLAYLIEKQIPYCLATNSLAVNTRECLELAGLTDKFSIAITRDDVKHGKPEPDVFLKAAQTLKTPIHKCMILEDSATGIEAAVRSGAFSVFIPSTEWVDPEASQQCDFMFKDLHEVLSVLKSKE